MEFESKDFMSMSDEDFAYETNLTREKVEKVEKMTICNDVLINFATHWENLTKYQKAFINKLLFGDIEDTLNGIMIKIGFNHNGMKFNNSIRKLIDWEIITAEKTDKKSRGNNGEVLKYSLVDNWWKNLCKIEF